MNAAPHGANFGICLPDGDLISEARNGTVVMR